MEKRDLSESDDDQSDRIDDNEVVFRRIPPFPPFHSDPDWLTTANFKLDRRKKESGLSVYRSSVRTVEQVLRDPMAVAGSFIVSATVREIRNLTDGTGTPLNLEVVADDEGASIRAMPRFRAQFPDD